MTLVKSEPYFADADSTAAIPAGPRRLIVGLVALAGFALTLAVYYPGVMTFDAKYIYADVVTGFRGDWQSPVMTELWRFVDPLAPGPASIFIFMTALYWSAFGVLGLALARTSLLAAILPLVFAAMPPAFLLAGIIWRDVLFAALWLLAAALVLVGRESRAFAFVQMVALALVAVGVLLRLNAIFAAPVLVAYILWPNGFRWKRTALLLLPLAVAFFALTQIVYYGVLDAKRQHALHSILVLDLGGISSVTGENQFPGSWSASDSARIVEVCEPKEWDNYWTRDPCKFVMAQLEVRDGLFGTSALSRAWLNSVMAHPLAYAQHRLAFFWHFLAGDNLTMWVIDVEDQSKVPLAGKPAFLFVKSLNDALKPTPLMRPGVWLLACIAICALAWRRRATPAGAFALGVAGSAVVYVFTYLAVGVASDFRFAYWAVIAGGAALLALRVSPPPDRPS
jgi:hypothetical protein